MDNLGRKQGPGHARGLSRRQFVGLAATAGAGLLGASALSGCSRVSELITGKRELIDDVGRLVSLPATGVLNSIYFTSPLAQVFCFTLAPELLAGTSILFNPEQLEFLPEETGSLEYMGSLSRGGSVNTDMLKTRKVQVIFSISGTDLTDVNIEQALALEKQTGIPVFLIDGSFDVIGDTYRLLGKSLGREDRAEGLASFCEEIYQRVTDAVAAVPEHELVSYYYAEGPEGLFTETDASQHSLAFKVARGVNAAAPLGEVSGTQVMTPVEIEKLRDWDPDIIITADSHGFNGMANAYGFITAASAYADLRAVKDGNVVSMPSLPFAFCDYPPGLNRFLGIQWLANLFYPSYYDVDMVEVVREFYAKCYWRTLDREQALRILAG
jgi:iron complex transport system substrate-binding protein